jgi:hypothetical protein
MECLWLIVVPQAVAMNSRLMGAEHEDVLETQIELARGMMIVGRHAHPPGYASVVVVIHFRARPGRLDEALAIQQQVLAAVERAGTQKSFLGTVLNNMALTLIRLVRVACSPSSGLWLMRGRDCWQGRYTDALRECRRSYDVRVATLGKDHYYIGSCAENGL